MRFLLLSLSLLLIRFVGFSQNFEFRSLTTYERDMSDVWGWSDDEGNEYAIASTTRYFSIVDVTDPENPQKIHRVNGPNTFWRDIKTYGEYAYGIHENAGSFNQGLVIMNLSDLQNEMPVSFWTNDGTLDTDFGSAHNIFIDEKGFAYIVGHNFGGGGVLILDLNEDPENPKVVGQYTGNYVHDCFARDNILYTSDENNGTFTIIDVTDKSNLIVLAKESTPSTTSHNNWLSDDDQTLFTTDENNGAFLTAYDISDLNDIVEIDRYQTSNGFGVIPHNVFILNDYAIISYYTAGVIYLDVSEPDNMVEMGSFDSPSTGPGFNGAWGVYPYLPSGNVLVTDIEQGLYVLTPEYKRATHLKGIVIDELTQNPIFDANVEITSVSGGQAIKTDLEGEFKDGYTVGGVFDVTVSKTGFYPFSSNYTIDDGDLLEINIELEQFPASNIDTTYITVDAFTTESICDSNVSAINANSFSTCNGTSSSTFGNWTIDSDGCLQYTAKNYNGVNLDEVCFTSENTTTGEYNINVVIVSIDNITSAQTNVLANGKITIVANPIQTHIRLKNSIEVRAPMTFQLFDVSGKLVTSLLVSDPTKEITIPVNHINNGIYTLSISSDNQLIGWSKLLKN